MNSNEFGILIDGCSYRDLAAVCETKRYEHVEDEFAMINGKFIEIDIDDLPFIQFGHMSRGEFPPPPPEFFIIKNRLEHLVAEIKVTWGFAEVKR